MRSISCCFSSLLILSLLQGNMLQALLLQPKYNERKIRSLSLKESKTEPDMAPRTLSQSGQVLFLMTLLIFPSVVGAEADNGQSPMIQQLVKTQYQQQKTLDKVIQAQTQLAKTQNQQQQTLAKVEKTLAKVEKKVDDIKGDSLVLKDFLGPISTTIAAFVGFQSMAYDRKQTSEQMMRMMNQTSEDRTLAMNQRNDDRAFAGIIVVLILVLIWTVQGGGGGGSPV